MPYAAPDSVGKHLGLGSSHNAVEDTYTHTCTCKFITARTGYVAPIQGVREQETTRLVPLVEGTTASSP